LKYSGLKIFASLIKRSLSKTICSRSNKQKQKFYPKQLAIFTKTQADPDLLQRLAIYRLKKALERSSQLKDGKF
jgi:hypothetical protein